MSSDAGEIFGLLSTSIDDEHPDQNLENIEELVPPINADDAEQDNDDHHGLLSKPGNDEHVERNVNDSLRSSDDRNAEQYFDAPSSKLSNDGHAEQYFDAPPSKLSDDGHAEQYFDAPSSKLSDDGYAEQNVDKHLSLSSENDHVEQALGSSHTVTIQVATQPRWQQNIYDSIQRTLKDISIGLNNIPLGLLRHEHLSQWNFENPSRDDVPDRPELFLQQEDLSEDQRATRIMDWLDKQFPQLQKVQPLVPDEDSKSSDRAERNDSEPSDEVNPRWFYTEVDFHHWLAGEDRAGSGSHPRRSFIKKGGDWRCKTCTYQGLQVWFDRMIAFCPLCKHSNDPYTEDEVTWCEAAFTSSAKDGLSE